MSERDVLPIPDRPYAGPVFEDAKDPEGFWYGDHYGVLAFEVNTDVVENVPQDRADLLNPEYNGAVALAGDPRVSAQAIAAVTAAGLANGGSLDDPAAVAQAGLDFWAQVAEAGNLVPVIAESGTVASGETPMTLNSVHKHGSRWAAPLYLRSRRR